MGLSAIAQQLSQAIGLDPDIVGANRIARAVEARQMACELPDLERYWARLQTSSAELAELVEQLIVPETWFFRDGKPFECLKTYVTSEWLLKPNRGLLRLLSLPCSTGEEPYSMAISLLEAGLLPKQFAIDAMDISQRSIAKAKQGIYTKNSFRGEAWTGRDRYFQPTAAGYELSQSVRALVNFQPGNAMTSLTLTPKQYDVIFCRNLLIYLQPEACSQVIASLDRLLVPGGLLFVGASETGKISTDHYLSIRQPFTFAYQKSAVMLPAAKPIDKGKTTAPNCPQPLFHEQEEQTGSGSFPVQVVKADLQTVKTLADAGQSADAIALCQTYLVDHPTSATAYILLGELCQAAQQHAEAEQCFRRAVYLEPNSYEALVHLALLKEYQGNEAGAEVIQQRIQRLQHRLETKPGIDTQKG